MDIQKLSIEQLDIKLSPFRLLQGVVVPEQGWIKSIRLVLKMTLSQMGSRLKITLQSAKEMEEREKAGTISLNGLKSFGEAFGMKFVYGFIPEKGSLEEMIHEQAFQIAREIVMRTAQNMELEEQSLAAEQLEKAIEAKKNEIVREMPRYLWD